MTTKTKLGRNPFASKEKSQNAAPKRKKPMTKTTARRTSKTQKTNHSTRRERPRTSGQSRRSATGNFEKLIYKVTTEVIPRLLTCGYLRGINLFSRFSVMK